MRSVLLVLVAVLAFAAGASYKGYKVYKLVPQTDAQRIHLKSLADSPDFDFWSPINNVGNPVTVMVSPRFQSHFEDYMNINIIDYEVEIEDVQSSIERERNDNRNQTLRSGRIGFTQYYRHSEINSYLNQLARDYSDIVSLDNIGKSYEGRDMVAIRISTGRSTPAKPVIFVDAGIHAREWIAPAMALYLINQLVENPANRNLIANLDWVILPNANPDGYEFSWTNNRLWRKTTTPGRVCNGCDPNRNFDYMWMVAGASSSECSETYAGPRAFSEVETRNLRDYILSIPNIKAYLTLHSYGNYLLYPWGYGNVLPSNWRELDDLGQQVATAIRAVSGTRYTVGSSTQVLYAAAGASDDWAMAVAGIDLVYCVELPGGGSYGFDLPASRITGVVTETFEGFKVYANYVLNNRS